MVDIVLTTYNGEKYLSELLDSLLAQTYGDIRIRVYDDGSTDGTEDIVRDYRKRDDRIFWHANPRNLGYTFNFLRGVKRSSADYVMLCDQDDIWFPDKVEKTLARMKKTENNRPGAPILVFTDAEIYSGRTREKRSFQRESHYNTKKVDIAPLLMENKCIGCTVMVNHALVRKLEHLPKDIRVHDWWMALIAATFGQVAYLDEMTLRYRQHEDNQIGSSSYTGYVRNRLESIRDQRKALRATVRQGAVFYQVFREEIPGDKKEIIRAFATLDNVPKPIRWFRMVHYGFTKSGWIRNVGVFFLL
ncbi:MAG: glycosyltransferase family 2 protein [Eubacterium sp.]|nr:glycosyltransferase family 2 protein [Eubacterium sp.]